MDPVDEAAPFRFGVPELADRLRDEIRSRLLDLPSLADVRFGDRDVIVWADRDVVSDDEPVAAIGEAGVEGSPCLSGDD
jgi:hypothetical protein